MPFTKEKNNDIIFLMKTLVVYVSRTGHCRTIAQIVSELTNAEVLEVIDRVDRAGKLGFLKAGASAAKKETSEIEYRSVNFEQVERLILVQPDRSFPI